MSTNTANNRIDLLYHFTKDGCSVPVYPYVTAITGHRTFAQPGQADGIPGFSEQNIKEAFKSELRPMAELWRQSCNGTAPFVLLTGLADGADQIAAEAALELEPELNVKIAAVLPMKEELFINTIENVERFNRLLEAASYKFAIPLSANNIGHESELSLICDETEPRRQEQYALLSRFLALHSHVLFAFWDGIPSTQLKGGTADTVFFKLNGNTETQTQGDLLTFSSVGPVVHLLIPRNNQDNRDYPLAPDLDMSSIPIFFLTRDILREKIDFNSLISTERSDFRCLFLNSEMRCKTAIADIPKLREAVKKIGSLNKDSVKAFSSSSALKTCIPSYCQLFDIPEDSSDSSYSDLFHNKFDKLNEFEDCNTRILAEHFSVADALAQVFQKYTEWICFSYSIVFAILSFAIGLLATYWSVRIYGWAKEPDSFFHFVWTYNGSDYPFESFCLLKSSIFYGAVSAVLVFIVIIAKILKFHYRYHRFRAIAEALRIQIFWRIAGMNDCVSGYYRSHQIPETEWIRATINSLDVFLSAPLDSDFNASLEDRIRFVNTTWVNGQRNYFVSARNKRLKHHYNASCFNHPAWMIILAALFFSLPLKGDIIKLLYSSSTHQSNQSIFLFVIIGLIISFLTSVIIYKTMRLKFNRAKAEAKRFEQILFPFDRAVLLLDTYRPVDKQQLILRQLGTEAISENVSWLLTVGEQDLNLPR